MRNHNPGSGDGSRTRDDGRDRPARRTAGHEPGVSLASLSEQIGNRILRPETPLWWWIGVRHLAVALLLVLVVAVSWLFVNGVGVWGIDIPVAWGLAIAEYVWWIALASGGTVISALFYLTRSPWRSATNRIAESMLFAAAACAGIMPILHLGRPWSVLLAVHLSEHDGIVAAVRAARCGGISSRCSATSDVSSCSGISARSPISRRCATGRERAGKQIFYGLLALGLARLGAALAAIIAAVYGIMAAIMAPLVISVHSIVGLDFAGGIDPRLALDAVPALFLFRRGDLAATALVIILTILVRWGYGLHDIITEYHLNALAKIMLVGSLMLSYAYVWEGWGAYLQKRGGRPADVRRARVRFHGRQLLDRKMLVVAIPQLLWFPAIRRRPLWLLLISAVHHCRHVARAILSSSYRACIAITSRPGGSNTHPTFWDWATAGRVDRVVSDAVLSVSATVADGLDVGNARDGRQGEARNDGSRAPTGSSRIFDTPEAILAAARHLRELGYRADRGLYPVSGRRARRAHADRPEGAAAADDLCRRGDRGVLAGTSSNGGARRGAIR